MITLRPLSVHDIPVIKAWPAYPQEFAELDYSLRDGGWLDEYGRKPGAVLLGAVEEGSLIGFSLLSPDGFGKREFRIALHPARIGNGMGRIVMRRTLEYAFADMTVSSVRLIVRKNNHRARQLYDSLHFVETGECTEQIQGKPVPFFVMEISRRTFFLENRS